MTAQTIISEIKKGQVASLYILHGEEPYYIDLISDYIEHHLLDESEKAFNQTVIYGKDVDSKYIIDEARQFPMMSTRRLIIVKEAQDLKNFNDLSGYIQKPVPHSVLVLCHKHKKIDKRSALGKMLDKVNVVFESKPFYDNQLPNFIAEYARHLNLQIDPVSTQMIADYLGNDLKKIANELDKLLINLGTGKKVTVDHIQDLIGISKEYNIFEFQNAIGAKDLNKTYLITNYFIDNPKSAPMPLIVSNLFSFFSKLLIMAQNINKSDQELASLMGLNNAYFLKDYKIAVRNYSVTKILQILVFLSEIDLKSKGVNNRHSNDDGLYRDLSFFIFS
jgi:DNA polymerase-3 subunit delta